MLRILMLLIVLLIGLADAHSDDDADIHVAADDVRKCVQSQIKR